MYNYPPNNFLYSGYRIDTVFSDSVKNLNGSATGFILEIGNGIPFIITNRHVIDLDYYKATSKYKDFKLSKISLTSRRQDDTEYTIYLNPDTDIYFHDNYQNDVVVIRPMSRIDEKNTFHYHFTLELIATKEIFNSILPFDIVCFSGFPSTHDKLMGRPILRTGTIASDPKFNYSWDKTEHGDCIAYEGFSSEGASGSPIFAPPRGMSGIPNSRDGFLIGVNAGHIPENFGHSGIWFFYKSTVVLEIIEKYRLKDFPTVEKAP